MSFRLTSACVGVALSIGAATPLSSSAEAAACVGVNFVAGNSASAREAVCLGELQRSVSRKGQVLTLRFVNGATKAWRSNPKACAADDAAHCVSFFLIGYHPPARVYSVFAQYYEGAAVDIVSAGAGQTLHVHGVPYFSPEGSVFVVLNNDMENGMDFDVAVGSAATTPASLAWKHSPAPATYWEFKQWIDADHALLRGAPEGAAAKCAYESCDYVVARSAAGWTLSRLPMK